MGTSSVLQTVGSAITLERELGRGGMGRVWLASRKGAAGFARRVVVKQMLRCKATDQLLRERFQREAALIAGLKHPNIIDIVDFVEVDGVFFMVMEYVPGKDLAIARDTFAGGARALPIGATVRVAADIANALAFAHDFCDATGLRRRIVHRDVTPENILVGWQDEVKLIDFGLAKDLDMASLTCEGDFLGKPLYMPPECLRGREPSPAWDIYGLGVTLYTVLAGRLPFEISDRRKSLEAVLDEIIEQVPPPVHEHNPAVPEALSEIVARAMAKDPRDRYPSASEMHRALEALLRTFPPTEPTAPRLLLGTEPPSETTAVEPRSQRAFARDDGDRAARSKSPSSRDLALGAWVDWAVRQLSTPWLRRLVALLLAGLLAMTVTLVALYGVEVVMLPAEVQVSSLAPADAVAQEGRIVVKCETWGYIHVDDRIIGLCPTDPVFVSPGPHTVAIEERKGTRRRDVIVEAGVDAIVDFRVVKKPIEVTVPVRHTVR
jgi:serine/threonine-protein kinase